MHLVSRDDLYLQVWARPLNQVAADYGVTGTALKKTCDRHEIPTPERGYWSKLLYGKRVTVEPLPTLSDKRLCEVRIDKGAASRLPPEVRAARTKTLQQIPRPVPPTVPAPLAPPTPVARLRSAEPPPEAPPAAVVEHPALAATRKAIARARPDAQGFASTSGKGGFGLKLAPVSVPRAIALLSGVLRLAEAQGHRLEPVETGLRLVVDGEPITVTLEEKPADVPHEPTAKELKIKADRLRWNDTRDPWLKYDHPPSGRLAVLIAENPYSGLRRTFSDGKTRPLENQLAELMAALAEHAALNKVNRAKAEEAARLAAVREARRQREVAFDLREKRRREFLQAIDTALGERERLVRVLTHLQAADTETPRLDAMAAWVRLHLKQCEARLSARQLALSAKVAEVEFDERAAAAGPHGADQYRYYPHSAELLLWSFDEATNMATSQSALEWSDADDLPPREGPSSDTEP